MEGSRDKQVSIISKTMVVPPQPTPTHKRHLFLSCFDLMWAKHHHNQRLIFYEGPAQLLSGHAVMATLKSSLQLCLAHYYPWCGRLVFGQPPDVRPFIDCNDAGVEFVEASVDLPISQLSACSFQMHPLFEQLCQQVDPAGQDSPLLSIQATLFCDGGLALGISQSHVVADGHALWKFMVSWGECARELPLSSSPLLGREILAVPNPSHEKATWNLHGAIKEEDIIEPPGMGMDSSTAATNEGGSGDTAKAPPLVQSLFILPSSAIKQLKMEDGGVHTSYEVICAHLWKHVSAARQRPPHEPTFFFVLVDCRSRLNPPLPSAYFGNAILFDVTVSTIGKICTESLHVTACRVHETVLATVVQDSLVGFMNWFELPENDLIKVVMPHVHKATGNIVASSPRFPVYNVDFGWGKPVAVRSPKVPGDGEIVLFGGNPNLDMGDVEFCVCLPKDVLNNLLEDQTFLGKSPCDPFVYK